MGDTARRGATLSEAQIRAASIIFAGGSLRDAAAEVGVHHATVVRWSTKPEWAALMADLEHTVVDATRRRLKGLAQLATDRLEAVLRRTDAEDKDTLRAVTVVFDRIGIGPEETTHVEVHETVTDDDLDEELRRVTKDIEES